jgi:hypothetical protein
MVTDEVFFAAKPRDTFQYCFESALSRSKYTYFGTPEIGKRHEWGLYKLNGFPGQDFAKKM